MSSFAHALRTRVPLVIALVAGGLGLASSSAHAGTVSQSQTVGGATVATIGLTLSPAVALTGVSPGATATGVGTATVVDTGPWTLTVADQASGANAGHPVAAGTGCTGSETALHNPLSVTAAGTLGTVTSSGAVSMSATAAQVASGTSSATLSTSYSVPILATEPLITGCVYSLTAVYTLQG